MRALQIIAVLALSLTISTMALVAMFEVFGAVVMCFAFVALVALVIVCTEIEWPKREDGETWLARVRRLGI